MKRSKKSEAKNCSAKASKSSSAKNCGGKCKSE